MPPIDYSNVNLTLQQFQSVSDGEFNAGDVHLAGQDKIEKINNHVVFTLSNKKDINTQETLAIYRTIDGADRITSEEWGTPAFDAYVANLLHILYTKMRCQAAAVAMLSTSIAAKRPSSASNSHFTNRRISAT